MKSTPRRLCVFAIAVLSLLVWDSPAGADGPPCEAVICPDVAPAAGTLTVSHLQMGPDGTYIASNEAPLDHPYHYRLLSPCELDTAAGDACRPDDDALCAAPP